MPVSFLKLPAEIQLLVLTFAHFRVIVRCRCVCKDFLKLIDSNPALKLIIELGASARRINPSYPGTSVQKLQELRDINLAWANLHWRHRVRIPFPENVCFAKFSGGRVFYALEDDPYDSEEEAGEGQCTVVVWTELPSRRNPRPSAPNPMVLEYFLDDMALDVARDLLIGVELHSFKSIGGHTFECRLHPISIRSTEKHPDASKSVISSRFFVQLKTEFSLTVRICGHHVGVLLTRDFGHFCRRSTFDVFYLWDWTTGVRKVHMNTFEVIERWESFCFITPDSVLISSTFQGHLNLFRFDEKADSLSHVYTFIVPESRYTPPCLRHISICSEPAPLFAGESTSLKASTEAPFPVDPDDAVVIVRLDYFSAPPGYEDTPDVDEGWTVPIIFAIPRRFLAQALRLPSSHSPPPDCGSIDKRFVNDPRFKRHPHCHSENWIHFTRWEMERNPPVFMQSYVCGSRFLGMTSRLEHSELSFSDISLYEFNLRNERRGMLMSEPNVSSSSETVEECGGADRGQAMEPSMESLRWPVRPSRIATKSRIVQHSSLLQRSFNTTLPYRSTESELVLDWDSAVIDEERIIGIKMEDGMYKSMDILVM